MKVVGNRSRERACEGIGTQYAPGIGTQYAPGIGTQYAPVMLSSTFQNLNLWAPFCPGHKAT